MHLELLRYERRTAFFAILTVFLTASTPAEGKQEWTCKRGPLVRKLIIHAEPYGALPCEIVYQKPNEGVPETVIARALRDFSFCESKAEQVALKLQNDDWECEREDS